MRYDRLTRWLHACIALGITAQLGLSQFMEAPDDKDEELVTGLPLALFEAHENIGMILFALIVLHWLWSLSGHVQGGIGHLFPWLSKERMGKVTAEARDALKLKLSNPEISNALAGAVHGLGLLVAIAMAASGAVIFFNLSETGHMTGLGEIFEELHGFIAPLMWAYLIGHVAVAVMHKRQGHTNVKEMFSLFK
jgi:cytochrome b561